MEYAHWLDGVCRCKTTNTIIMKTKIHFLSVAFVATVAFLFALSANSTHASFIQAPAVGANTGAEILITWNGTNFTVSPPSGEGPYDGLEDTLYGIQNNSTAPLLSVTLTGLDIMGFDGDGIDAFNGIGNAPGSPPGGATGYEGWTSLTSAWNVSGSQQATSFTIVDANHGTVHFGASGIAPGGSAFFALEGRSTFSGGGGIGGVPDAGSTLICFGMALGALAGLKRHFCRG
jgi:hypothetical protein